MQEGRKIVPRKRVAKEQYGWTNEEFVIAWQTSSNVDEAVEKLSRLVGKPVVRGTVTSRAAYLFKLGVKLKKMPRRPQNESGRVYPSIPSESALDDDETSGGSSFRDSPSGELSTIS